MNDIYVQYEKARNEFYIEKRWVKINADLMKEEYVNKGLPVPCDGLVKTKDDAQKAVAFYTAFYNKLEYENKLNDEIKEAFNRTIKKYTDYEENQGKSIMTLNDFIVMLQKQVDRGYGGKNLFMEGPHQCNHHINSVQMNTCSGIEPDYLFIMAGEEVEPS